MTRARVRRSRIASIALLLSVALGARPSAQTPDLVDAAYQQFYAGDVDGAEQQFARLVARAPRDLAARFGGLIVFKHQTDADPSLQAKFKGAIDAFLADAEHRYSRTRTDDEALLYLASGYLLRAQYRLGLDEGVLGAARDGARMKRYAEAYIERWPDRADAYLPLGIYNYYVDLAPSVVKAIRVLLFLPGGDRAQGLKQIELAHRSGKRFGLLAGLALTDIYATFEPRPDDAVAVAERLAAQYPASSMVQLAFADIYLRPAIEEYAAAATRFEAVIAREDRHGDERIGKYRARLGLANARVQQWRMDEAIAAITQIIDANPRRFWREVPRALLARAMVRALLDDGRAVEDVRRVRATGAWKEFHKDADRRLSWIETRRRSGVARVYAALIPGNRLAAAGRWDEASAAYQLVDQRYPNDAQVRFRIGHLTFLQGLTDRARHELMTVADNRSAPPWLRAEALLYAARAADVGGRRDEAKDLYRRILDEFAKEDIVPAARAGLSAPYRRRQPVRPRSQLGAAPNSARPMS